MKYRLWLVVIGLALLAQAAFASTPLQDKAIEALRQAYDEPNGKIFEHGGMIVANQGTLRFIEPYPDNDQPDGVYTTDRKMLLSGDSLVGTYHTHPCMKDYYHQYFSRSDVIVAMFSGVPAFMLDECTGDVHEFFTAVDEVRDTGDDLPVRGPKCVKVMMHLPLGRVVGNIGESAPEHVNAAHDECKK